jgi:hypothetical protein
VKQVWAQIVVVNLIFIYGHPFDNYENIPELPWSIDNLTITPAAGSTHADGWVLQRGRMWSHLLKIWHLVVRLVKFLYIIHFWIELRHYLTM